MENKHLSHKAHGIGQYELAVGLFHLILITSPRKAIGFLLQTKQQTLRS